MGHIFDALQRSEAERSGIEVDAFDLPTELLQVAEAAIPTQVAEPEVAAQATKSEITAPEPTDVSHNVADTSAPWRQFESLPVSLPPYSKLVSVTDQGSLPAEKFRFLAVRLRHLQQRRPLRKLVITSTMPEEGKSTVAANLACTLASRRQQKILLLEGDLRRPILGRQLGLGRLHGLSEYLQGVGDATTPIYSLDSLGIWIMPAGGVVQNPFELMQSGRLSPLVEQLNTWFDWIVIDSPPVLPLGDTSIWMRLADGILLVTRQGVTDKEQLQRGVEAIELGKLIGALLNGSTSAAHNDYYYHRYAPPATSQQDSHPAK